MEEMNAVNKPHARGDEPFLLDGLVQGGIISPTHVGMNRCGRRCSGSRPHKPHARGDEPFVGYVRRGLGL